MKRDWAQTACFDEMFSLLSKDNWNFSCKKRCCAQKGTGQGGTILKKTLSVPKNDGNGENPLYLICELGLLCPNAPSGRPTVTITARAYRSRGAITARACRSPPYTTSWMTEQCLYRILSMTRGNPGNIFRNLGKEKDQGNERLHCFHCFFGLIRSLSVPSAPSQQGPFSVWEYSDHTKAKIGFL